MSAKEMGGNKWIPANTENLTNSCAVRISTGSNYPVKPFIKWAGGKTQILDKIRQLYPPGLGITITRYAEPFVGGGAVLFDILSRFRMEEVYISDINRELIATYVCIRDNVNGLVTALRTMEQEYLPLAGNDRKAYYYEKRARYNTLKLKNEMCLEIASLFIFLNRTCFNGLYRVNSKGEFNVPVGNYKNPTICDEDNLLAVSEGL